MSKNNWQKQIDGINRKAIIKKKVDKLLTPVRNVLVRIDDAKDSITSYIENKKVDLDRKRSEKEEKQAFQHECRNRYNEFLNSFDRSQIGEKLEKSDIESDPKYLPEYYFIDISKITYVTDKGPITKIVKKYPYEAVVGVKNPSSNYYNYSEEYEGFYKDDNGQYLYGNSCERGFYSHGYKSIGWNECRVVKRDKKGHFTLIGGHDCNDLINRLDMAFRAAEKEYNQSHKEQLGE